VDMGDMEDEAELFFVLTVPEGATEVSFDLTAETGATGDSDLYVRFGEAPTAALYDCRPFTGGAVSENCTFANPEPGEWHVRVHAWSASTGYSLTGTHTGDGGGAGPTEFRARHVFQLRGHRTRVLLAWEPSASEQVDILYNGDVVATTANDGNFTHTFQQQGSGTVTYQACNAGSTTDCSAEITVNYQSRP
jgi:hypothetical protein